MKIGSKILILFLLIFWQEGQATETNPNTIDFTMRLGNQKFNTMNATGKFLILSGTPSYEAVLVRKVPKDAFVPMRDSDYKNASWTPYDGIIKMHFGPMEGFYQVELSLKGETGQTPWIGTLVKFDQTPPQILISNPTSSTVAVPYIQLQGCSAEQLKSVVYDLSNAVAVVTNQPGQILGDSFFDASLGEYTTDYFQCFDIPLTNGLNTVTLHATDLAGNVTTTNFNFTLNYAAAANPVIQLTWPQGGMDICGNSFTLRGQTEDASAIVIASITDTNGNTTTINGMVERNGTLWVNNLPLHDGTNNLTLTVKNSAGLSSATNICVTRSSFALTMNKVKDDLWLPKVNVTGFESDATYAVWVNGVKANVLVNADGSGKWMAHNVPVTPGGVASFNMHAYAPNEKQPDGSYANGNVASAGKNFSSANLNNVVSTKNSTNHESALVVTSVQPVFIKISQADGTFYFTWSAASNSIYQLQYTTDLTSTNWSNLNMPITATSNSVSVMDILPKDAHRFYRVQLVQ
jgi:hypothetical protein